MNVDISEFSKAQWFDDRGQHSCGYCKNRSGSISYGMYTEELTVEDYKDLIDRGWRRSGKYCYKPIMDKTCCPQYTIRCDAMEFKMTKSHKKIIKKFNKFLNDGIFNKNVPPVQQDDEVATEVPGFNRCNTINLAESVTTVEDSLLNLKPDKPQSKEKLEKSSNQESNKKNRKNCSEIRIIRDSRMDVPNTSKTTKKSLKDGTGPNPNKPPCKKAKILRLERKKEKLLQKGKKFEASTKTNNMQKTLSQFLEEIPSTSKHKLKLKIIPTSKCGEEWEKVKDVEFELYAKYQIAVHNDTPKQLTMSSFMRFLVTSPLKIVLERMDESHEHFNVSAELFKKYQMMIHNEPSVECAPSTYIDFLIDTPLKPKPFPIGIEGPGYGSFHQQYWIGDKLRAVGVIDILPGCISSVYFFYDPDYRDLTLGTYGSLREIQLVQDLQQKVPDLKYYYMGFYIHSCPKMRYKGKLSPSKLLCPETYVWMPIENCLEKLDANKYSRLNNDVDAIDTNDCNKNDVNTIRVIYDRQLMYAKDFIRVFGGDKEVFENMANLIGKKSSRKIIFWMG